MYLKVYLLYLHCKITAPQESFVKKNELVFQ